MRAETRPPPAPWYGAPIGERRFRKESMSDEGIIEQRAAPLDPDPVHYPDSDGRFLPENPLQARAIISVRVNLMGHFQDMPNIVLEGDMFLYYKKGKPRKSVAPHVFVVRDHDLGKRTTYKLWVERKPPDFALEVVSPTSKVRNQVDKKALYASLGIQEYFLFQPDMTRAEPRLLGYRLWGRRYVEVPPEPGSAHRRELRCETLGVSLRAEGELMRVRNLATGRDYPWIAEWNAKDKARAAQIRAEAAARRAAERATREETARRRAAELAKREEAARRRAAEQESLEQTAARRAAEAEVAELRALLAEYRSDLAK